MKTVAEQLAGADKALDQWWVKGDVMVRLGKLPPDTLLSVKGLAGLLGVCIRTVFRMIDRCELPQPFRIGRRLTWKADRIRAWFDRLAELGEKETERQLRKIKSLA